MRRHIVSVPAITFDTRARILTDEIQEGWDEKVKEMHRKNYANLIAALSVELGPVDFYRKIEDFKAIGSLPFSIVSYHNEFLNQARGSFVQGHYYPALTAACALGERIINHLILDLREYYKDKKSYSKIAGKSSLDNWQQAIHVLSDWGVLLPEASKALRKLEALRHRSLHFTVSTYDTLRDDAVRAIKLLCSLIESQFSAFGGQPWFIEGTKGACFIKAAWEQVPFIRTYYLPLCPAVGIYHAYSNEDGRWILFDYKEYEGQEISDEDFRDCFNARDPSRLAPTTQPPGDDVVWYEWGRRKDVSQSVE